MSDDERALLAAMRAEPDSDLPRLVYADWLDDHDWSERAELIRLEIVQRQLNLTEEAERKRYAELGNRIIQLRTADQEWRREVLAEVPAHRELWVFIYCGGVEQVYCPVKYFLEHGATLFDRFPVRQVGLTRWSTRTAAALARCPHFRLVHTLHIDARMTSPTVVQSLLDDCLLDHLLGIRLTDNFIERTTSRIARHTETAARIARCSRLGGLRLLDLSGAQIGDDGGEALAASTTLRSLVYLDLMHNNLSATVASRLVDRYGQAAVFDYSDRWRFRDRERLV